MEGPKECSEWDAPPYEVPRVVKIPEAIPELGLSASGTPADRRVPRPANVNMSGEPAGCENERSGNKPERMSKFSVIVPTLNEERHIGYLLSDIAGQTRKPDEVLVVDAGSKDGTVPVVRRFPFAELLEGTPPVACGRNLGGRSATGNVLIFLDADVRLPERFFEDFLGELENRRLDVACPLYVPYRSTPAVKAFHALFNLVTRVFQGTLPSGAGHCIAVRRTVFQDSRGFDPGLKFDDIELIRRLSRGRRFGIVEERVFVSDRRYREQGTPRMILRYSLMAFFFTLGKFHWANRLDYEFGGHEH